MFARVSTFQGSPGGTDEATRFVRERILPAAAQLEGFLGMLLLVAPETGRTMSLTLWETEDHMRASEEAASRLRAESTEAMGEELVSVERFEVAIDTRAR